MKHLVKLFRLLEITRSQQQYGYSLAEIQKSDISDLAQHHYLVAFFAWQIARDVVKAGAKLNIEKVLAVALIHDLGELFGGDIGMPYARANPKARELAKKFEYENLRYFIKNFAKDDQDLQALAQEVFSPRSDEARIAKIADYAEVTHYRLYNHRLTKGDVLMAKEKMMSYINEITDKKAMKVLKKFVDDWSRALLRGKFQELFEQSKLKKT